MCNENNSSEKLRCFLVQYFQNRSLTIDQGEGDQLKNFADENGLEYADPGDLQSTLWDMVMERIIEPRCKYSSGGWVINGFQLTQYGWKLLEGLPIDRPSKYLDYLESQAPNIDPQIVVYVRESLSSYNLGCYFASSVMLGVASERLFEILVDAYANAIQSQEAQTQFKKRTDSQGISKQYDEFKKKLPDLIGKNGITGEDGPSTRRLRHDFKHAVELTFDQIRSYRDYAAHPRDGVVPRDIIKDYLGAFPLFCQRFYQAIEWLKNNKV